MSAFKFAAESGVEEGKKKKKQGMKRTTGAMVGGGLGAVGGAAAGLAKEPAHMALLRGGLMAPREGGYGDKSWLASSAAAGAPLRADAESLSQLAQGNTVASSPAFHEQVVDLGQRVRGGVSDGFVNGYKNVPLTTHLRNAGIGAGIGGGTGALLGALLSGQREVEE